MATAARQRPRHSLDTTVELVTPERIVFRYPLAGPFRRYFAYLIDVLIVLVAIVTVSVAVMVMSLGSISSRGPILAATFAIMWGYRVLCEVIWSGQTLGKRIVGIRVVSDRGVPITAAQAVLRNVVGWLDGTVPIAMPELTTLFLLAGLTSMLLTRKFQRLGDLAAGTMVVVEERRSRAPLVRVDEPAVRSLLPRLPLRLNVSPELSRALSDYVKHRGRFGRARREEMAEHLARPLRARLGVPGNAPADTVLCAAYHRVYLGE
jgi:uncharacterized RDD family membrane protein YckC